jgi:hypothetical protein
MPTRGTEGGSTKAFARKKKRRREDHLLPLAS